MAETVDWKAKCEMAEIKNRSYFIELEKAHREVLDLETDYDSLLTVATELDRVAEQIDIWTDDPWIEDGARSGGELLLRKLKETRLRIQEARAKFRELIQGKSERNANG